MKKQIQEEYGLKCNETVDGYTNFIYINRFGGVQHQGTLNKALRRIIHDCNYEVLDDGKKMRLCFYLFNCVLLLNHNIHHKIAIVKLLQYEDEFHAK